MKKSISLFSGIGGLDEGLHQAGYTPVFCSELDEHAYTTLKHWCQRKGISPLIARDINDIGPNELMNRLSLKLGDIDLLAGGPPCQPFSLIGKRMALNDDRGLLLMKMVEFAKVFKPKAVLIEQVKGLISAKGSDGKTGSALTTVIKQLEAIGYSVSYKVLRAADYGIPQLRDRVFIVGCENKCIFQFPKPTHFDPNKFSNQLGIFSEIKPYLTLKDVISDLPAPSLKKDETIMIPSHVDVTPPRDRERITGVPEGECLAKQLHLPKEQRLRLNPKKDTTKFRRMCWDLPTLTLRGGEAFYHPTENRYLTPKEYLRIHGFDDDFLLFGPIRARTGTVRNLDQHRLVANAVPPLLGEVVAREIYKHVFEISKKAA